MFLFRRVTRRAQLQRLLQRVAVEMVDRAFARAWSRVGLTASSMPPAERRGYLRARVAGEVQRQLDAALRRHDVPEVCRTPLAGKATDLLVQRIEAKIPNASEPSCLRRAA